MTNSNQIEEDLTGFLARLNSRDTTEASPVMELARAPARLDVMGGIADYSGSSVLEFPLGLATVAGAQRRKDPRVRLTSFDLYSTDLNAVQRLEFGLDQVNQLFASSHAERRDFFRRNPEQAWGAYVVGALLEVSAQAGAALPSGLNLFIGSTIPQGKGLASSAALCVASARALAQLLDVAVTPLELGLLAQRVENHTVGAPSGVMDPLTAAAGAAGQLLEISCQPAEIIGTVPLRGSLCVSGIDSGIRHAVSGAAYGRVRTASAMGYRMIAALEDWQVSALAFDEPVSVRDPAYGGYLANISVERFSTQYEKALPSSMTGAEFLVRFGKTADPLAKVDADDDYPVRAATAHPVYEHQRVRRFRELAQSRQPDAAVQMGRLMLESHRSYSACGLGSLGTDQLVERVLERGRESGLYGAKVSGGGSGGTVVVLSERKATPLLEEIRDRYISDTGRESSVFTGSSAGTLNTGPHRAEWKVDGWRLQPTM